MKTLVFLLVIGLFTSRDTPPTPEEIEKDPINTIDEMWYYNNRPSLLQDDNLTTQLLMEELGLDNKESVVNKSQLSVFVLRLITLDDTLPSQETDFYDKVIKRYTVNVPERFPCRDIKKYLDSEDFNEALKNTIIELYGEDTFNEYDKFDVTKEYNATTNSSKSQLENGTIKRALKLDL